MSFGAYQTCPSLALFLKVFNRGKLYDIEFRFHDFVIDVLKLTCSYENDMVSICITDSH